jgi:hypothetical protein
MSIENKEEMPLSTGGSLPRKGTKNDIIMKYIY